MANKPVLIVRSITNAMRGQKLLENQGVTAYIVRNSDVSGRYGCGFGIKIDAPVDRAVDILADEGIRVVEVIGG
ncbi:putative Se/S carrier-like protein [Youxingia wuxianensis]|uniref:DUF3343 domain-containing protein n=1 Tax=Youxingia wuxianensis TaxID=2763678 RepID=A0A926EMX9_9FIRM|nr:putative Se/S carrier-like protein [Youxingia wuxianensis]MBC8584177.1 DUF3343 domain-containing protein [Youxingia wuxianensis]